MVELIGLDNSIKSWGVKDYAIKWENIWGSRYALYVLLCVDVWYNLISSLYCIQDPQVGHTEGMTSLHLGSIGFSRAHRLRLK